jgi:dipeptidyl aminopeptidase/acylaminoacyl peptidase
MTNILKNLSPLYHVSANDAPVLIIHGDKDDVVPIRQSELLLKKLKEANVPASLIIKKGEGHGWNRDDEEIKMFIDWFDKYLK